MYYVRYDGKVARRLNGKKLEIEADDIDAALIKARKVFWKYPRLVEVFNRSLPAPDPRAGDEGRAWWAQHGY